VRRVTSWAEIGIALGLSRERVRQLAVGAIGKIRRTDPGLAELYRVALRIADRRSVAQEMIDDAPSEHERGEL
jgi:DNA-directed RNA polymerase sigma subunit (sigma70/sigma32)